MQYLSCQSTTNYEVIFLQLTFFSVNGPLAAFTTILLTLSESSTIITLLSRNFLIADALVDTFDGTLVAKNEGAVVAEGRQLKSGGDSIDRVMYTHPVLQRN